MNRIYPIKQGIVAIILALTFYSCDSDKEKASFTKEIDIHLLFVSDNSERENKVISDVKDFLWFVKNEQCRDTAFIPRVKITRLDLKKVKSDSLVIPLSLVNRLKRSLGTIRPYQILTDYEENIPKLDLPGFVLSDSEIEVDQKEIIDKYKIDYRFSIDSLTSNETDLFYDTKAILKDIKENLCEYRKTSFTILYGYESLEPLSVETSVEPCYVPTVEEAIDLKGELIKIIDVSKSDAERLKLANRVWDEYFTEKAYVNRYLKRDDKSAVDTYDPGQGKAYFISRLAILPSITDVNIFRIEFSRSKGEEHKISGIHLVECHNAAEIWEE